MVFVWSLRELGIEKNDMKIDLENDLQNHDLILKISFGTVLISDLQTNLPPPSPPSKMAKLGFYSKKLRNFLKLIKKTIFRIIVFLDMVEKLLSELGTSTTAVLDYFRTGFRNANQW